MKKDLTRIFFVISMLISTVSMADPVFKFVPDKSCAGVSAVAEEGYHFEKVDDKTTNIVQDKGEDGINRPVIALICEPNGCNAGCVVITGGSSSSCNCKGDGQCSFRAVGHR